MFGKLPQGMGKFINLRIFFFFFWYFNYSGLDSEFPRGFGRLISLKTISHILNSGKDDTKGCKLRELKKLEPPSRDSSNKRPREHGRCM